MNNKILLIENEIDKIKQRNKKVEIDKAWEMSKTRHLLIIFLTYIIVLVFFIIIWIKDPHINAIVPVLWFYLSTLSLKFIKNIRIKKYKSDW